MSDAGSGGRPRNRRAVGPEGRLRIAMVGPARTVRGGISAVVNALLVSMPPEAPDIRYIATHVDGPKWVKALAALAGFVRVLSAILFWRCHIVHVHTSSYASFSRESVAARIARIFRRKLVVHVHGSEFDVFHQGASAATRSAIRHVLTSADVVVALSDIWRGKLARMAPDAKIRVLPNPVVVDEFAAVAEQPAEVPEDGGTVLFLGAFGKRKGIYDLLAALELIVRERPGVVAELGGDQEVDEVRRAIDQAGLSANVRVLGWVRGGDKLAAFGRAHAYVLPSYHEGLPIGILEAMAAGLPIVTTPVGGIPEVVKDGVNGLIVTPGDVRGLSAAVLRLLGDDSLRTQISARNAALARSRHDAVLVARTLVEWYHEISGSSEA